MSPRPPPSLPTVAASRSDPVADVRGRPLDAWLMVPAGLLLVVMIGPLLQMVLAAPPGAVLEEFARGENWEVIGRSVALGAVAAGLATLGGVPLAYLLARRSFPGKRFVETVVQLPVALPHVLIGLALLSLLGPRAVIGAMTESLFGAGFVDTRAGVVAAMMYVSIPYVVSSARAGFEAVPERLEKTARTLGATPWAVFREVTLPLARSRILDGVSLTWGRSISELGAIMVLAYHPLTVAVYMWDTYRIQPAERFNAVGAMALIVYLSVFFGFRLLTGGKSAKAAKSGTSGKSPPPDPATKPASLARQDGPAGRNARADAAAVGPAAPGATLTVRGLVARQGTFELSLPSLQLPAGEVLVVLGRSGAGKTLLLETLAGFAPAVTGTVQLGGRDIGDLPPERRRVGVIFQDYALFPHLDVRGNILFGARHARMAPGAAAERMAELCGLLEIGDLLDRPVDALSGGQKQRVGLARALMLRPELLVFDEPLAALDAELRERLRGELRSVLRTLGQTAVFVTHDRAEARVLGDCVGLLERGALFQIGATAEVFARPAGRRAAEFLGFENLLPAVVEGPAAHGAGTRLLLIASAGGASDGASQGRVEVVARLAELHPPQSRVLLGVRADEVSLRIRSAGPTGPGLSAEPGGSGPTGQPTDPQPLVHAAAPGNGQPDARWGMVLAGRVESLGEAPPLVRVEVGLGAASDGAPAGASLTVVVTRGQAVELGLAPGVRVTASVPAGSLHVMTDEG